MEMQKGQTVEGRKPIRDPCYKSSPYTVAAPHHVRFMNYIIRWLMQPPLLTTAHRRSLSAAGTARLAQNAQQWRQRSQNCEAAS